MPMPTFTTFDSIRESLQDVLKSVREGKTQLPDFQRGWVWDDEHIRSLLASISLSFPIGAVMMLQTGNPDLRLKPRLVEGATLRDPPDSERLILDGQQRLTSLFQSLVMEQPVTTRDLRGKPIKRWYYLDIAKALSSNGDREDAIVGLPEDRCIRNFRNEVLADYTTIEKECAAELFPLSLVFDVAGLTNWQMKYVQIDPSRVAERLTRWNRLVQEVIQRFQQYQLPLILLRKETPKEAVCQVFEKVNTGGVPLNVFELLTATFAADNYNLRDDWASRERQLRSRKVLKSGESTDFLQAVTLLATRERRNQSIAAGTLFDEAPGISCKRKEVLRLSLRDYQQWADEVAIGFEKAAKFLHSQRIYDARDLPYRTQLTPLAAILAILGPRSDNDGIRAKLAQWYWCGVFGELYGGAIETRFAKDLPEVIAWLEGGALPSTIADANFAASRLLGLRTRNSAAYKGVHALLMREGCLDFRSGYEIDVQAYFDDKIDIHHIFPQDWCRQNSIDPRLCDCIVNKTAISARTNRMIGGNAPSEYVMKVQRSAGVDESRMNEILQSHQIEPQALRDDDFAAFLQARTEALLDRIEQAMGKPVSRDVSTGESDEAPDYEPEDG